MPLIPNRFVFRMSHPCRFCRAMPEPDDESLFELTEEHRLENFAEMDGVANFADVRLAWNDSGIGLQLTVSGKNGPPMGTADRPRGSDGVTLWLDTRGDRTSHRASRTCHQFHFLAVGGGSKGDDPLFLQTKINRALQDAPFADADSVLLRVGLAKAGYRLQAFIPTAALNGFDPAEHPKLGIFYSVRDGELGEQTLSVDADFPFADDPSLWSTLELVRP